MADELERKLTHAAVVIAEQRDANARDADGLAKALDAGCRMVDRRKHISLRDMLEWVDIARAALDAHKEHRE